MQSPEAFRHKSDSVIEHAEGKALHVLFIVMGYPSQNSSSLGVFYQTMAESLRALGVDVEIDAPVPWVPPGFSHISQKWARYKQLPERYLMNGIQVHCPRYFHAPYGDFWLMPHVLMERATRSMISRRPDIIHAHFAYPSGLVALALSNAWDVPTILTLHGSDVHRNPYANKLAMRRFQRSVRTAACVTTVSRALAEQTIQLCGRRPEVIPIGIRLERFAQLPSQREARMQLGLPQDRKLALFIGALVKEKGCREFAAALGDDTLADTMGIVVGDGPLRRELAAQQSLSCLGYQPNEKIPLLMRACDLIVLPSYGEGMPTVLIEAGAAGLPILASRVGGIPELLEGDRGTVLDLITGDDVRHGIRRIIDDPVAAAERSACMKTFIETHYDALKNASVYAERYRACTDAHKDGQTH